ncbi:MAG: hypothetical protein JWP92_3331 [Caulobacter sp.]|nr:hypothetical protein [Caulobacter sp.]
MKTTLSAILIAVSALASPALAQAPTAAPSLDERVACGVMLVSIDELGRRYPGMMDGMGKDKATGAAITRMMGVSGAMLLDAAYAEGSTQGLKPSDLYRRGVGHVATIFKGVESPTNAAAKQRALALLNRCMMVATPTT